MDEDNVLDSSIVECLENHPVLWDCSHKDYKKLNLRKLAVKNIAALVRGDSDADIAFVNERIKAIKAKLVRRLRPAPSGSGAKKMQVWPLEERLGFLKDQGGPRKTVTSVTPPAGLMLEERLFDPYSTTDQAGSVEEEVEESEENIFFGASTSSSTPHRSSSSSCTSTQARRVSESSSIDLDEPQGKKKRANNVDRAILSLLNSVPTPPPAVVDVNETVCLTLLAALRSMTAEEALDLRATLLSDMLNAQKESLKNKNKEN